MIINVDGFSYDVIEPSQGIRNWLQSVLANPERGDVRVVGLDRAHGGEVWLPIETLRRAVLVVGHE